MKAIAASLLALLVLSSPSLAQRRADGRIDLTGKWALTVKPEGGTPGTAEVTLVQRGDSLIGRYAHQTLGLLEVVGNVKGRDFSFAFSTPMNGQQLTMNVKGVVESADSLSGTATLGPMGSANFTATRQRER